jgi:Zn-finger nucleic acid-binding protein
MEQVEFEGVEVDRCRSCQGIWFDAGESDWFFNDTATTEIYTGDPEVGKHTNQINRYRCPRCDGGMMRKTSLNSARIQYEECTSCRGSFFDAGEFTDLIRGAKSGLASN